MYRIVVIDDEFIVVEGIKAIIKKQNMDCEVVGSANDGIDGLEIIRKVKPDVVITDIRMPGLDGLSLIEMVKEELSDIRFVVISGYTDFEYTKRAIKLGVKGYIDKPITIEKLEEVIEKLNDEDENMKFNSSLFDQFLSRMMDAVIKENSKILLQECESFLGELTNNIEQLATYKKDCFRLLCVLLEMLADQKRNHEDWMHVSYMEIEKLKTLDLVKDFTRYIIKKIAATIENGGLGSNHYIVNKLLLYIGRNYNKDIGLTELADEVGMNPSYLCILFKEEVGMSYVKYLTNLRMNKAKELLKEGHKVSDVSEMVGYNNYRYFCNIFKKHIGKTPNEYKGCVRK